MAAHGAVKRRKNVKQVKLIFPAASTGTAAGV
jgi:hypothetical protein